jgi:hypothetical protein
MEASTNHGEGFCIRCMNCQARFQPSPGRTPVYTDEERTQRNIERVSNYRKKRNEKIVKLLGGICVDCGGNATRVCYIGPGGWGPKARDYDKSRTRLLRDDEYRADFAPYCAVHGPTNYFTRAKQGKMPPPSSWGWGLLEKEAQAA